MHPPLPKLLFVAEEYFFALTKPVCFANLNSSEQQYMPKALKIWARDPCALLQDDWKQSVTSCPVLCGDSIIPNLSMG